MWEAFGDDDSDSDSDFDPDDSSSVSSEETLYADTDADASALVTDGSSFTVSSKDTDDSLESSFGESEDERDESPSTTRIPAAGKYEHIEFQQLHGARQNVNDPNWKSQL